MGQRGSQSRGAQEQRGIGGAFLSSISLRDQRNGPQGAGDGVPASSCYNPTVGGPFRRLLRVARNDRTKPGLE